MTEKKRFKKPLFITVDVEAHRSLIEFWGNIGGDKLGLDKILQLLGEYNLKATFFVDFCEVKKWGEHELTKIVDKLRDFDQDIQLHVHPHHFGDPRRWLLWEYNKEEQEKIIEYCAQQYIKIVGTKPIAFRAGGYGANLDTLNILNTMGVKYDSSLFHGNKKCGLHISDLKTINRIIRYKEIYEIPVTVFNSINLIGKKIRFDKLDLNGATTWEIKRVLRVMENLPVTHVIIFLHSSSFLKRDRNNQFKPNQQVVKKFKYILNFINTHTDYEVMTISDFDKKLGDCLDEFIESSQDIVYCEKNPFRGYLGTLYRAFVNSRLNSKARYFMALNLFAWAAFAIVAIIIILRWVLH